MFDKLLLLLKKKDAKRYNYKGHIEVRHSITAVVWEHVHVHVHVQVHVHVPDGKDPLVLICGCAPLPLSLPPSPPSPPSPSQVKELALSDVSSYPNSFKVSSRAHRSHTYLISVRSHKSKQEWVKRIQNIVRLNKEEMERVGDHLVCLSICLSICVSVCVSVYLYVSLSLCLSTCLCVCFSICLYMYVGLFVHVHVCLSVCTSVCMSVCLSVSLSVSLSHDNPSIDKVVNKVWGNQTQPSLVSVSHCRYHLGDGKKVEEKVDSCGTRTHNSQLDMLTLYRLS